MEVRRNDYSNPAFCQKSEFLNRPPKALSPLRSVRQSPVGAQTIPKILDTSLGNYPNYTDEDGLQEQEFYEEVFVDANGFITDKKVVIVAQNNEGRKYIQIPQNEQQHDTEYDAYNEERPGNKFGIIQDDLVTRKTSFYSASQQLRGKETKLTRSHSNRYEYIQMKEKTGGAIVSPRTSPQKPRFNRDDIEVPRGKVQRYNVVDNEEETALTNKATRYALVPVEHLHKVNQNPLMVVNEIKNRHDLSPENSRIHIPQSRNQYNYYATSPQKPPPHSEYMPQQPRFGNPAATQKLHELLSTPKKTSSPHRQFLTPQPKRKTTTPNTLSPLSRESFRQSVGSRQAPRAQQKLNYPLSPKELLNEKRHTAVVAPICSSPIQSVYSETTYSYKSESWMNLSVKKSTVQITLTVAAAIMLICGSLNSSLCFYMIYKDMRRQYFLDFGIVSGFTCLILGILGCRTRNIYWLPNRNYISGYLLMTVFSLLTCAGLLVLLLMQPKPGTPLADITSGAVCCISVLSLVLAMTGVLCSYCCRYPPPDNRVQHCAEGFTV